MKKNLSKLGIYVLFIIGLLAISYAIFFMLSQLSNCPPNSGDYDSFLSKWLNINYFDIKIQFRECMDGVRQYCNIKGFSSCGTPNFKPVITFGVLGITFLFLGIRLRKKYILS